MAFGVRPVEFRGTLVLPGAGFWKVRRGVGVNGLLSWRLNDARDALGQGDARCRQYSREPDSGVQRAADVRRHLARA